MTGSSGPSGGGCWYKAKCEMLLCKIDGKNERAKLWIFREMETVATCSTTDGNGSYHGLVPSFFEEMIRFRRQKHRRRRPDNPNGPSKFRKYSMYLPLLRLFTSARSRLLFHGCYAPARSYFEEMTCCQRQKLHWRWPGKPNGRSKFRNLGLFTFTRLQMTLCRRFRDWWRLSDIAQTARNWSKKHRRDDPDRSKFRKYENLCLWDEAKRLEKLFLLLRTPLRLTALRTVFFLLSLATGFGFTFEK